jgi:hypothetical protein
MSRRVLISLMMVILCAGMAFAASDKPTEEPPVTDDDAVVAETSPNASTEPAPAAPVVVTRGATFKKIARAKRRGDISEEEAILYKVYAVFDLDKLPEQYRGQMDWRGVTPFLILLRNAYPGYSEELQEKLKPYINREPKK